MTKTIYLFASVFAAGLFAISAAYALPLDNGRNMNGLSFNGRNMNGLSFNGRNMNGLSFNGRNMNGLSFNGAEREGVAAKTVGRATNVILKDGEQVTLR